MYVRTYVCMCVYIYIYIHIHICLFPPRTVCQPAERPAGEHQAPLPGAAADGARKMGDDILIVMIIAMVEVMLPMGARKMGGHLILPYSHRNTVPRFPRRDSKPKKRLREKTGR